MQYGKIMIITSNKNEKIKKIIKLRNKNKRDKYSLFLIEGYKELLRASKSKIKIESLFICEEFFLKDNEYTLIEEIRNKNSSIYDCTKEVFEKISYRDRPDGLIAIAKSFKNDLENLKKLIENKKNPLIVVLEGIEKPGNLGTIIRTAAAAGVDAIIVTDPKTDIFNPNVVRASIGTLFTTPIYVEDSKKVISFLNENKINIISATPHAKINYTDVDLKKGVAIAFGTEQVGLSDIFMKNSNHLVKIPMFGDIDSLNVAQSTTILLYEAIRQRKFS
ncbi:MAG: 23S rRNA (uridine(2479)-2'-O)-methyltransferase [Candidatus Anoxychlamydiales bacterium]|nr:23S rRNA (uridine(2479)-2'-O)-methyltransferase [Candidatus Anoxychlamydiales bacterium]